MRLIIYRPLFVEGLMIKIWNTELILFTRSVWDRVHSDNLATSCIHVCEYTLGRAVIARACPRGWLGRAWVIWLLWCVSVQGWRVARDVFTVCPAEYCCWFPVLDCSGISTVYLMRLEKNYWKLETLQWWNIAPKL